MAVGKTILVAVGAYVGLLVCLRIAGKRATAKLNEFDWAVTVALGSMLATTILSDTVPLAVGVAAFATVIGLQFLIAWLGVRSEAVRKVIKAEPSLLYYRGRFQRERMRKERITEEDVRSVLRSRGLASFDSVTAVILETSGDLSVVTEAPTNDDVVSSLQDVQVPEV